MSTTTTVTRVGSAEWEQAKREGRAVYIGRACRRSKEPLARITSRYANPFRRIGMLETATNQTLVDLFTEWRCGAAPDVDGWPFDPPTAEEIRDDLAGKVLGCWCHPKPCHGDVLAAIGNAEVEQ